MRVYFGVEGWAGRLHMQLLPACSVYFTRCLTLYACITG